MSDDKTPAGEVWWIFSDKEAFWAGLRIAHFGKSRYLDEKGTLHMLDTFFIMGEANPRRIGIRMWDEVSEREGWFKVRQLDVPGPDAIAAARKLR